jgi:hypothetical protein
MSDSPESSSIRDSHRDSLANLGDQAKMNDPHPIIGVGGGLNTDVGVE